MVGRRFQNVLFAALMLSAAFVAPTASAQEPEFLLLGEDATGDAATADGVPMIDTMADINGLSVATVGEELVFHLGMQGTTTEAGEFCFIVHFKADGTDYIGFDCFDCAAYECTNAASPVYETVLGNSRGDDIAGGATLLDDAVEFRFAFADFGGAVGTEVSDIYGLVYFTRGLEVVDTLPDAKRDRDAAEALGPYTVGGATEADPETVPAMVFENLTAPSFLHAFENATSDDYTLNFTVPWHNVTLAQTAEVQAGTANVTVLRDGEVVVAFLLDNRTAPADDGSDGSDGNATEADGNATEADGNATEADGNATEAESPVLSGLAGNWSVVIDYTDFVGTLGLTVEEHVEVVEEAPAGNETEEPSLEADVEEAPGVALPLMAVGLLGAVFAVRRRD